MNSPGPREDNGSLTVATWSGHGVVWILVCGEADLSNREQLRASLDGIALDPASVVYLDLRELWFCDSYSCRTLLQFEQQSKAAGRDIRIYGARPIVRRIMTLVEGAPR